MIKTSNYNFLRSFKSSRHSAVKVRVKSSKWAIGYKIVFLSIALVSLIIGIIRLKITFNSFDQTGHNSGSKGSSVIAKGPDQDRSSVPVKEHRADIEHRLRFLIMDKVTGRPLNGVKVTLDGITGIFDYSRDNGFAEIIMSHPFVPSSYPQLGLSIEHPDFRTVNTDLDVNDLPGQTSIYMERKL